MLFVGEVSRKISVGANSSQYMKAMMVFVEKMSNCTVDTPCLGVASGKIHSEQLVLMRKIMEMDFGGSEVARDHQKCEL